MTHNEYRCFNNFLLPQEADWIEEKTYRLVCYDILCHYPRITVTINGFVVKDESSILRPLRTTRRSVSQQLKSCITN